MSQETGILKPGKAPPVDPHPDPDAEETKMTLMEHLVELRVRLMWIVGALLVLTLISMVFVERILEFITLPLTAVGIVPQTLRPTDTIAVFFKVSFTMGTAFALPMIIYQVIAFMAPGLYPHEKRAIYLMLPGVFVLFMVGAAFAWMGLIPPAVGFLNNFLGRVVDPGWTMEAYVGFVTRLVFWIGVAFELPLVVAVLARTGLVSGRQLLRFWRHAMVLVSVAAALITPTVDPVNMTLVMGPLLMLYFISVGLAYLLYRPRQVDESSEPQIPE